LKQLQIEQVFDCPPLPYHYSTARKQWL
jgi:hypothetical protein